MITVRLVTLACIAAPFLLLIGLALARLLPHRPMREVTSPHQPDPRVQPFGGTFTQVERYHGHAKVDRFIRHEWNNGQPTRH